MAEPDRNLLLAGPAGASLNATRDADAVGLLLTGEPGPPARLLLLLLLPPMSVSAAAWLAMAGRLPAAPPDELGRPAAAAAPSGVLMRGSKPPAGNRFEQG
jgi:hypothetical protein